MKPTSPSPQSETFEGEVQGHRDGYGFVLLGPEAPDVMLPAAEMRSVLHGDRVRVRVVGVDRRGRPEGRVLEILERRRRPIIGRLLSEAGGWLVAPEDRRFTQDILIPASGIAAATAGQVVAVELTEPPSLHTQPVGRVTEVLGEIDDPGMEIEIAVRKYEVPHQFSPAALAQSEGLPSAVRPVDRRGRVDLRDVGLVTIDGEDARDFDDAVYCEPYTTGRGRKAVQGWRLLVAIADVSHYVKPGEAIDADAHERATSVYFPRRVIPMLPEKLSNGLCSLNPDVERLSMVCDMVVDAEGSVQAYQFYPAVIRSQARLTYTEVAAALVNSRGMEAQRLALVMPQLRHLQEVYRALLKQRQVRGAIDFETTETQMICDAQGRIERIVPRTRNEAHRLIEEAMLAANVCAAEFIASHARLSLYRVHEGPTPEKKTTLQNYLRALGLGLSLSDDPRPSEYQALSQAVRGRPDAHQIQTMLLRSMQQAIYTPINAGHFGLAYEAYTHFTSPIRRYPDLLVHRTIKAILQNKKYTLPGAGSSASAQQSAWEAAGLHCSTNERRADEASRDVESWLKCRYMRDRLGEEFDGTVSAATSFGLFVQLSALYVEGLVHITELGGEYYRFDEVRQELRGERTGIRFGIGTAVRVQVSRVDLDSRRIDFRLVRPHGEDEGGVSGKSSRRKGRDPRPARSVTEPALVEPALPSQQLEAVQRLDRDAKAQRKRAQASLSRSPLSGKTAPAAKAGKSVKPSKRSSKRR